jgi:hypothetical protein
MPSERISERSAERRTPWPAAEATLGAGAKAGTETKTETRTEAGPKAGTRNASGVRPEMACLVRGVPASVFMVVVPRSAAGLGSGFSAETVAVSAEAATAWMWKRLHNVLQ